jgi:hypothetical protein
LTIRIRASRQSDTHGGCERGARPLCYRSLSLLGFRTLRERLLRGLAGGDTRVHERGAECLARRKAGLLVITSKEKVCLLFWYVEGRGKYIDDVGKESETSGSGLLSIRNPCASPQPIVSYIRHSLAQS